MKTDYERALTSELQRAIQTAVHDQFEDAEQKGRLEVRKQLDILLTMVLANAYTVREAVEMIKEGMGL